MTFSDVFAVAKVLFLDWRIIAAFIAVFLYLNFVFYVSKYKKKQAFKPKRVVKKSADAPEPSADAASTEDISEDDVVV